MFPNTQSRYLQSMQKSVTNDSKESKRGNVSISSQERIDRLKESMKLFNINSPGLDSGLMIPMNTSISRSALNNN